MQQSLYEGCPESIQEFWIPREPAAWPWCNLTATQRRPYSASMNSHSPVRLVSRQWDAVDWACVLCGRRIHNDRASRSTSSRQCACSFCINQVCRPALQPRLGSLRVMAFPKAKIAVEWEEICDIDGHRLHKLSQRCLTAEGLDPRKSDCSRMHSKISSDRLSSYIKATRLVLEVFNMAGYFPNSPRIVNTFGNVDGLKCFTVLWFTYTIGKLLHAFLTRRIWSEHIMLT
jgi:hypothetical protein